MSIQIEVIYLVWLMLMLMLICYERKTLFVG